MKLVRITNNLFEELWLYKPCRDLILLVFFEIFIYREIENRQIKNQNEKGRMIHWMNLEMRHYILININKENHDKFI